MKLFQHTVDLVLARVPGDVQALLQLYPVVLAGGAIRDSVTGDEVKDLDVFCHSEEQAAVVASAVAGPLRPRKSLNAYNVICGGLPVQFVYYRDFTDALSLVEQFDYRACGAGIYWDADAEAWAGVSVPDFYADCFAKVLTFTRQDKDAGSLIPLRRALKLAAKGWRLNDEGVADILSHWSPGVDKDEVLQALAPGYGGSR